MGNESGTWVMYGVDWNDPECIHTVKKQQNILTEQASCLYSRMTYQGFRWKSEQFLNIGGLMMLTKTHGFGEL